MDELVNELETVEEVQYIVVKLGDEQYGIDIGFVDNIVRLQQITRVPKSQPYFVGVINLRGEVVPIMSLRRRFGLEDDDEPVPAPAPAPAPAAPAPEPAASSSGGVLSQEEIEKLMNGGGAAAPAPAPAPAAESGGGTLRQEDIERLMAGGASAAPAQPVPAPAPAAPPAPAPAAPAQPVQGMPAQPPMQPPVMPVPGQEGMQPPYAGGYPYYPPYPGYPYYPPQQEPKLINTAPPPMPRLENGEELSQEQTQNLDLIMGVPLEVTVEIGRTRKRVQEILSFSKGSLVVLDKLAGDQVDLFVNGKCIAHGDVVVVDDNFGIRVTEILKKPGIEELAQQQ